MDATKRCGHHRRRTGPKEMIAIGEAPDPAGSDHARNAMDAARSLAPEAEIIGTYSCQGQVNPKVLEKARNKPQPPVWLADAPSASGHSEVKNFSFGRQIYQMRAAIQDHI